jgi:hypothetical protein
MQGTPKRSDGLRENGAGHRSQVLHEIQRHKCHMAERAAFSASAKRALRASGRMKNEGQIFPRWCNTLAWGSIAGLVLMGGTMIGLLAVVTRSPYLSRVDIPLEQPVPFSHEHHVGRMGIDCRYCHTTSEISPFAGVPSTVTCMTCHSQVWKDAPVLQPIRDSFLSGKPLAWNRVHDLPDFVYFDHSAHVNKGVACHRARPQATGARRRKDGRLKRDGNEGGPSPGFP